jgi:hypothetical protein
MFTFIICKYLTRQLDDQAGKAFMVIITMVADYLLIMSILELLT